MVGLILEGGGMRCAFTAGVLDCWLERNVAFKDVYGVSAGVCQACSYLCRQPGRGLRVWVNYLDDWRFCSWRSLLTTGDLFGAELSYDLVPRKLDPLDNDAFLSSGARLTAVVTNTRTGQAEYLPIRDMFEDMAVVQATASLPLVSNMIKIGGQLYLDGGIADSIPIRHAISDGCVKNVAVLTQARGYVKTPNKALRLMKAKYRRFPKLVEAVARRHEQYNETLRFIEAEESAGRLFVLRPETTPEVGRIEKNPEKLKRLHAAGYAVAEKNLTRLRDFLSETV